MNDDGIQNQNQSIDGANSEPELRTLQLLQAGSFRFGIFADEIAAIAAWREPTPLPLAPKSVLGVVNIQGRMLTVLDLGMLPGCEEASTDAAAQLFVALRGDEQLAIAVDGLGETIELADGCLETRQETKQTLFLGVLNREGTDLYILNPKELFPTAIQGRERRRRRF